MSVHENEFMNQRQVATNELSAAARLDRATEDRLYRLYRAYFQKMEEEFRWVVWTDIPWEQTVTPPSPVLIEAVWASYQADLFLPDYSARSIQVLRASRGRAWFLTRWAYEEGKHILGLNEWLVRSGAFTNVELRESAETLLNEFKWEPESIDGLAVYAEFLSWEIKEVERYHALRSLAQSENEPALTLLANLILRDEKAHRDFYAESLRVIAETYPSQVRAALNHVADDQSDPAIAAALRAVVT